MLWFASCVSEENVLHLDRMSRSVRYNAAALYCETLAGKNDQLLEIDMPHLRIKFSILYVQDF